MKINYFMYPWGFILIIILILVLLRLWVRDRRKGKAIREYIQNRKYSDKVKQLNEMLKPYGFYYNTMWDCFSSRLDAWQKDFGYCGQYDDMSPYFNMIFDCEPIYFEYDQRFWLIEFWKGQYGITVGAEVGIYYRDKVPKNTTKVSDQVMFHTVKEKDYLPIGITLWNKEQILFEQKKRHWWLASFVLGSFTQPQNLHAEIEIVFPNQEMCLAFLKGLQQAGYEGREVYTKGYTVFITFDIPHTKQPRHKKKLLVKWKQKLNKRYCKLYNRITRKYDNTVDKVLYLTMAYPFLFNLAMKIGKTRELFKALK